MIGLLETVVLVGVFLLSASAAVWTVLYGVRTARGSPCNKKGESDA